MNARRNNPGYIVKDGPGKICLAEEYRDFSGVNSNDFCRELLDYVKTHAGDVAMDLSGADICLNDIAALFHAHAIKVKQGSRFEVSGLSEKMKESCAIVLPFWKVNQ
jgi:hypothetical protein